MDRRSLVFFLLLTVSFLGINYFFDFQRQESLQQNQELQKARKIEQKNKLQQEIESKTAKFDDLPLVKFYADSKESEFLSYGFLTNGSLITLSWTDDLPKEIYINKERLTIAYHPDVANGPLVYEKKSEDILPIGDLPFFGAYDLQMISFQTLESDKLPKITYATYTDGFFAIPFNKYAQVSKELGEQMEQSLPKISLVIMKVQDRYLPVATYNKEARGLMFLEQISGLETEIAKLPDMLEIKREKESYYLLENEYMQVAFSDRGAAVVEINLPFEKEGENKSNVKEIEFDREILENHMYNAYFPTNSFYTPTAKSQGPYKENSKGKLGGYYPLLRRKLIQTGNRKSIRILPEFYALNIVSQYPEMAELNYSVKYFDKNKIIFEATQRARKITKTYTLSPEKAPFCFDLTIDIEGDSKGLWLNSGVIEVEWISNAQAPALRYHMTRKGKPETANIDLPKDPILNSSASPDWISTSNGFFGIIIDPTTDIETGYRASRVAGTLAPSRLLLLNDLNDKFTEQNFYGFQTQLPLESRGKSINFRIFAGPLATNTLKTVDNIYSNPETGYVTDYISTQSAHGWFSFISAPFAKFLFVLMRFFYFITGSWAFSIILLTIALRVMLFPLNAWSTKSMLKMQQISPKVQKIQAKYKNDPKKSQLEIMNLYREQGVNPVSGCFPILIQMPFLFGMFDLLKSTFELRGAAFIPGWIDNLAAPDVLLSWTTPIFFIGNQLHLLPLLLGAVMYMQQKLMSTLPKDASQLTDQQKQQKMMGGMMTILFSVMFYHVPSGLNLYWLSSMILGILQQWWTGKRMKTVIDTNNETKKK